MVIVASIMLVVLFLSLVAINRRSDWASLETKELREKIGELEHENEMLDAAENAATYYAEGLRKENERLSHELKAALASLAVWSEVESLVVSNQKH